MNEDYKLVHNGITYYNYLDMKCEFPKCKNGVSEYTGRYIEGNYCKRHYKVMQKRLEKKEQKN